MTFLTQANDMADQLKAHISAAHDDTLRQRIARWQAAEQRARSHVPTSPLPPLVKRARGLPKALDPLYVTLVKHLHELD